jgi:hypothetical protein
MKLFPIILFMAFSAGVRAEIEINVLKPPEGRKIVWCIQSPYDQNDIYRTYSDGGSKGVRITLVDGTEATLFRFNGLVLEDFVIEGFTKGHVSRKIRGDEVVLISEERKNIIVKRKSRLHAEILEAYKDYFKENNGTEIDEFILEILEAEPVDGANDTR